MLVYVTCICLNTVKHRKTMSMRMGKCGALTLILSSNRITRLNLRYLSFAVFCDIQTENVTVVPVKQETYYLECR